MSYSEIPIKTPERTIMIDISPQVQAAVSATGLEEGIAVVYCPHTTAGITINENADPAVKKDMIRSLNKLIPYQAGYTHLEGNSDAHIKATLTGLSVTVPVFGGRLALGTWQGIYFCEYDGPRNRRFIVKSVNG
ncbi:secondary thiamine-phosphate synthase enzyme YjbQ [Spirochaeta isovalerica]|uniref:Secondary thiamine-phosphate synthase enzyme n=1 Tax=Spirochaeta isovalerica TaxID=150 RepID=A0A841RHW0_9SPIO|nr:secondary thiamine-phosphate synthase enzyme YjbQ [Spirochaeta isovalerica]MBB6482349.1 secondary thiamine-phosphate synthase enzyme [Spirochaeta isovalerica]